MHILLLTYMYVYCISVYTMCIDVPLSSEGYIFQDILGHPEYHSCIISPERIEDRTPFLLFLEKKVLKWWRPSFQVVDFFMSLFKALSIVKRSTQK